jgi:AcrR family transcriptional regulator
MTIVEPGLRERKRVATKRAIELAAITITAEKGLERLTIDEIVHEADVSPRTFFNYFPSKEAALIGEVPALPDPETIDDFVRAGAGSSILHDLAVLLGKASAHSPEDIELSHARRAVLKDYPELFAMRMVSMREFEDQLGSVVQLRLAADEPSLSRDHDALQRKARLVTLVAFAAIKHAWVSWADDPKASDLQTRILDSFSELESLCASSTFH